MAYHGGVNKLQKVLCLLTAQAQRHRWKSDPNSGAFTTNEPNLIWHNWSWYTQQGHETINFEGQGSNGKVPLGRR